MTKTGCNRTQEPTTKERKRKRNACTPSPLLDEAELLRHKSTSCCALLANASTRRAERNPKTKTKRMEGNEAEWVTTECLLDEEELLQDETDLLPSAGVNMSLKTTTRTEPNRIEEPKTNGKGPEPEPEPKSERLLTRAPPEWNRRIMGSTSFSQKGADHEAKGNTKTEAEWSGTEWSKTGSGTRAHRAPLGRSGTAPRWGRLLAPREGYHEGSL